jgi:hypothetical protein
MGAGLSRELLNILLVHLERLEEGLSCIIVGSFSHSKLSAKAAICLVPPDISSANMSII